MRCKYSTYMSTQYDDVSYHWLVAKHIVLAYEAPSDIGIFGLCNCALFPSTHSRHPKYSYCLRIPGVRSTVRYPDFAISTLLQSTHSTQSSSPYLPLSNVNRPESLLVQIIMRLIFHACRYFYFSWKFKHFTHLF